MAKPRKYERFTCKYFSWTLQTRNGIYWADGRSNLRNAGRHSLGTKNRDEAMEMLQRLDLTIAIENGMAAPEAVETVGRGGIDPNRRSQTI